MSQLVQTYTKVSLRSGYRVDAFVLPTNAVLLINDDKQQEAFTMLCLRQ